MIAANNPFPQIVGLNGLPLENGKVYFGVANLDPRTNPVSAWWDYAGTISAAQPVRTIGGYLARSGSPALAYVTGAHSIAVYDANDVLVWYAADSTQYNIEQRSTSIASTLATDLAVKDDETKGMGLPGFDYREPYAIQTGGWGIKEVPGLVNALLMVPPAEHAAIKAGTTTYDAAAGMQAALTAGPTMIPGGVYKTGSKLVANYSVQGTGQESSWIASTSNAIDIVEIADGADFLHVSDLKLVHPSNGTGRGLVLKNINNDVVINRVAVQYGAVGIDVANIAFRQRFQDCRVDYAVVGFQAEGRSAALTGAGTTVTYDRCYVSNGVQTGWNLSFIRSVDFLQPAADIAGWGSGIVCTGVGHLNILGGHFEGTPGADGEYIRYSTSGSLSHGIAITGLCIEGPNFTGRTFRFLNIQANDDHVRVDLTHVNFRGITGTTTNAYLAKISGAVGSKVTIIANGCDFGVLEDKFDLSSMSGDVDYRKIDSEKAILARGTATLQSGQVINTGVVGTDPPRGVYVQHKRDDGAVPTVMAHVTQTYSGNDDVQVRFTLLSTGAESTGVDYDVNWWVTT